MSEAEILKIIADWLQENHADALLKMEPARVDIETSIADELRLDSLDQIEMVMALEERFQVQVPDKVAGQWQTVGDIVKFLSASPVMPQL